MIRLAEMGDMPTLLAMGERFFEVSSYGELMTFDPQSLRQMFAQLIEGDAGVILIAQEGGEIAGFLAALLYPFYFNNAHFTGQEIGWWVAEEHRSGGHGKALIEGVERWARHKGAKTFSMIAIHGSQPETMAQIYAARGYKPSEYTYIKEL